MTIVKPRIFKVKPLDGPLVYYGSLKKLTKALQSYSLEKLKKIEDMRLIILQEDCKPPEPIPASW